MLGLKLIHVSKRGPSGELAQSALSLWQGWVLAEYTFISLQLLIRELRVMLYMQNAPSRILVIQLFTVRLVLSYSSKIFLYSFGISQKYRIIS